MSAKYPDFSYANTKLPTIVDLYRCSSESDNMSMTFQEIYDFCFRIPNYEQVVSDGLKDDLRTLKLKGAVDFNDNFADIRLDKIKLCLLTTNPDMSKEELSRRSEDPKENYYKMNIS